VPANVAAGSAGVLAAAQARAAATEAARYPGMVSTVLLLGTMLWAYGMFLTLSIICLYLYRLM
jgi:hypothetical protein